MLAFGPIMSMTGNPMYGSNATYLHAGTPNRRCELKWIGRTVRYAPIFVGMTDG